MSVLFLFGNLLFFVRLQPLFRVSALDPAAVQGLGMMAGPLVRKGRSAYLRVVLIHAFLAWAGSRFVCASPDPSHAKIRGSGDFEWVKDLQKIGQKQTTDEF